MNNTVLYQVLLSHAYYRESYIIVKIIYFMDFCCCKVIYVKLGMRTSNGSHSRFGLMREETSHISRHRGIMSTLLINNITFVYFDISLTNSLEQSPTEKPIIPLLNSSPHMEPEGSLP
jgi:hypothetical protein